GPLPDVEVHDCLVLAGMGLVLVADLPEVGDIGEQASQAALVERPTTSIVTGTRLPALSHPAACGQLAGSLAQGLLLEVQLEDRPHPLRLGGVLNQFAALGIDVVAEDGHAARPFPLAPRCRDLVAGALRDDLPLELGE